MKRQRLIELLSIATIAVSAIATPGCSPRRYADAMSLSMAHPFRVEPWTNEKYRDGVILRTRHYAIHTTVTDSQYQHALTQVMEDAYQRYQALAPAESVNVSSGMGVSPMIPRPERMGETPMPRQFHTRFTGDDGKPLECYVFARRQEWEAFTTKLAPSDAPTYFRINRGGYTIGERVAVFSSGQSATCRSMAHEGWHQYAARHSVDRLPPFLEEGIACLFENVRLDERGKPVWDMTENPNRSRALRMSAEAEQLFPLETLITLHAGEVVGMPSAHVEAFYAQSWAFARFLWDGENGRYRPAMKQLLADAVAGELVGSKITTTVVVRPGNVWDSRAAAPLLVRYLAKEFAEIDRAYQRFVAQLIDRDARRWTRDD